MFNMIRSSLAEIISGDELFRPIGLCFREEEFHVMCRKQSLRADEWQQPIVVPDVVDGIVFGNRLVNQRTFPCPRVVINMANAQFRANDVALVRHRPIRRALAAVRGLVRSGQHQQQLFVGVPPAHRQLSVCPHG